MQLYRLFLLLVITVSLAACSSKPHATEKEEPQEEKLFITAYNSEFELFAEADPFVAGRQSNMLAHFTRLENFKPLGEGSITISLLQEDGKTVSGSVKPVSEGIYRISLQPSATGKGRLQFDILTSGDTSQMIVSGITVYDNETDAQKAAEAEAHAGSNTVVFTKEQSWKIDFATEEVKMKPFGVTIRTVGQIEPSQSNEKVVVAKAVDWCSSLARRSPPAPLFRPVSPSFPWRAADWLTITQMYGMRKPLPNTTELRLSMIEKEHLLKSVLFLKASFSPRRLPFKMQKRSMPVSGRAFHPTGAR